MTPEQQTDFINRFMGTAVDAFTNARMKTILLALLSAGVIKAYSSSADFDQAVADNPDTIIIGFVAQDTEYSGEDDAVLIRVPGRGIGQMAVDFLTDET